MDRHVTLSDFESLPPLHCNDYAFPELRDIVSKRQSFGIRELSPTDIERILNDGYAIYFMRIAANGRRIGGRDFEKLRDVGRLDLTVEYVLFHHFRDRLDPQLRRRIASLLARSVSHPHARWESESVR